jgi:hypothetical protein
MQECAWRWKHQRNWSRIFISNVSLWAFHCFVCCCKLKQPVSSGEWVPVGKKGKAKAGREVSGGGGTISGVRVFWSYFHLLRRS